MFLSRFFSLSLHTLSCISVCPLISVWFCPHAPDHDLSLAGCPSHCMPALSLPTQRVGQAHTHWTSALPAALMLSSRRPTVCRRLPHPSRHFWFLPWPCALVPDGCWSLQEEQLNWPVPRQRRLYLSRHPSLLSRPSWQRRRFLAAAEAEQLCVPSSIPGLTSRSCLLYPMTFREREISRSLAVMLLIFIFSSSNIFIYTRLCSTVHFVIPLNLLLPASFPCHASVSAVKSTKT